MVHDNTSQGACCLSLYQHSVSGILALLKCPLRQLCKTSPLSRCNCNSPFPIQATLHEAEQEDDESPVVSCSPRSQPPFLATRTLSGSIEAPGNDHPDDKALSESEDLTDFGKACDTFSSTSPDGCADVEIRNGNRVQQNDFDDCEDVALETRDLSDPCKSRHETSPNTQCLGVAEQLKVGHVTRHESDHAATEIKGGLPVATPERRPSSLKELCQRMLRHCSGEVRFCFQMFGH